ncbi:exodeoxyribonuclease III [Algihabitans albus]|uniref:exodeoxyribonuclease III n=1 Tax=Algihabitans albus TaxID=2164067 RepID=UPI000E5D1831|nr:exodeoxyribonuclease III [Algihabitans albus]
MVKIASWNVNSIKTRLPNVLDWLDSAAPDVLLLQELKCQTGDFPEMEFTARGYKALAVGQKSYNGVAILSRDAIEDPLEALPGDPKDEQARYLEVTTCGLRVASIYLPNGNPLGTEKFGYKLDWMQRLTTHARSLLLEDRPVVLGGDYNVIPEPLDCHDPAAWRGDALFQPESRAAFRGLLHLGYFEAYRVLQGARAGAYTFWDYQGGAWQADEGIRIDHLLLSAQAADRLEACDIDRTPRGRERPSDHTPIWCSLTE